MEQMTITEKVGSNYVLLEITGALNAYTITEFQAKAYAYIRDSNLVLDLSHVTTIDSTGMSTIMACYTDGKTFNTKLYLINPSEEAKRVISATGFLDFFDVIHSVAEIG